MRFSTWLESDIFWHGSPKQFDKFDYTFIGSGLGHYEQGPGFYFTNQEVDANRYGTNLIKAKLHLQKTVPLKGKPIAKETYPGEFTTIVDIRCEELPGQQQGDQGSIYGIAYILTRGTAEAPPKLDPVTITSGYRFDRRIKQD